MWGDVGRCGEMARLLEEEHHHLGGGAVGVPAHDRGAASQLLASQLLRMLLEARAQPVLGVARVHAGVHLKPHRIGSGPIGSGSGRSASFGESGGEWRRSGEVKAEHGRARQSTGALTSSESSSSTSEAIRSNQKQSEAIRSNHNQQSHLLEQVLVDLRSNQKQPEAIRSNQSAISPARRGPRRPRSSSEARRRPCAPCHPSPRR